MGSSVVRFITHFISMFTVSHRHDGIMRNSCRKNLSKIKYKISIDWNVKNSCHTILAMNKEQVAGGQNYVKDSSLAAYFHA